MEKITKMLQICKNWYFCNFFYSTFDNFQRFFFIFQNNFFSILCSSYEFLPIFTYILKIHLFILYFTKQIDILISTMYLFIISHNVIYSVNFDHGDDPTTEELPETVDLLNENKLYCKILFNKLCNIKTL